jgi:polyisoprenoid-binding protein YceI
MQPVILAYIDSRHAHVGFAVRHLAVANVRGRFENVAGWITLDVNNMAASSVAVAIDAASVSSGHLDRDAAIRSADLLDTERFKELRFQSTRIERAGDTFVAVGDLTIRDVTKEVRIPFSVTGPVHLGKEYRIGVEAELAIDRRDFGMSSQRMAGSGMLIGNHIKISIDLEAANTSADRKAL